MLEQCCVCCWFVCRAIESRSSRGPFLSRSGLQRGDQVRPRLTSRALVFSTSAAASRTQTWEKVSSFRDDTARLRSAKFDRLQQTYLPLQHTPPSRPFKEQRLRAKQASEAAASATTIGATGNPRNAIALLFLL